MAERNDLLDALVKQAKGYQDRAPVLRITEPLFEESMAKARELLIDVWPLFGDCSIVAANASTATARMQLPEEGRVDVFRPSGAIAALMRPKSTRKPIALDERTVDRRPLLEVAQRTAAVISKSYSSADDQLRFENQWEMKGQGVTLKGEKTAVALFEVLSSFRRYLHGLPVLGRASVHVGVAAGLQVVRWGIDWRRVQPKPFAETPVISPEEGAARVTADLWWRRAERPFTLKDFTPQAMALGYLSLSRRRQQFVMQPCWVAVLKPTGGMSTGHVVAVPAAPRAFEPIDRGLKMMA